MKNRWQNSIPHPATMFFLLTLVVIFLSWIFEIYGLSVINPANGQEIRVQSLLSPEGIRWWLRNVVKNFTGFAPLGMVMVTMFGLGVADHSGFINACIRQTVKEKANQPAIICLVIFLGIVSNVVGDAGYIILIPIAAMLFQSAAMHPVAGIITAYVSVACGYSANIFISTLDPLLAQTTQEAAVTFGISGGSTGTLSNYYFMFISTFLITGIIYLITKKYLLPALGTYKGEMRFGGYKPLSRKERRAFRIALIVGLLFALVIIIATFSPWGILRGITGGITRSPFIAGALFLLSLGAGLMGMVYGFISGRYRSDKDVIAGFSKPMGLLSVYFVIAFFAAQMFASFEFSHLDKCLAIWGADMLSAVEATPFITLLFFIIFSGLINLIMVSATAKWSFMAFIFIPVFSQMGISPDWTQCAYRIGDSVTNAITPFLFYMPLILAYMQQYNEENNYASLLKYTWRYSLYIFVGWVLLFCLWFFLKLPLGM